MLGLLLWHETTGSMEALDAVRSIGDLLCRDYLGDKTPKLVETGSTEMNLGVAHSLALLHNPTRLRPYLEMALQIVGEFAATLPDGSPMAGDYVNASLSGSEFYQMPKPRWEGLHPVMALAELYYATGREDFRKAFAHIWGSIVRLDRHNNGGFSSGEQAQGNPYHQGAIETCCTIAWVALTVEMLRMTKNPLVADELELSTLNSVLGMHSHTGRWVTYDTPMDGVRKASAHSIVFQAREGSPELNCCSVNGPRGFGMVSDWALMTDGKGLILNWYGESTFRAMTDGGEALELEQKTDYPRDGKVVLDVRGAAETEVNIRLRIPRWSRLTSIRHHGKESRPAPGTYFSVGSQWGGESTIEVNLDMSPHYWVGERECAGKVSVYRGPLLLAYDRRFNDVDPDDLPTLDARGLKGTQARWAGSMPPLFLTEFEGTDGRPLRLCDFGSAGEGGSPYISWLPIVNADEQAEFWSGRQMGARQRGS
jgi:DUF1680 family protein